jgi:hypothetical protein
MKNENAQTRSKQITIQQKVAHIALFKIYTNRLR